ncbi:ParB/RepB/Spo0J family partition protein [Nitrosomonas eutropha]|uniref:ParB/RepB/Spo0J family partition protein n=1 Tax=Nitrosomonas eutropha TaxID=916 RepID=A0A1I7FCB2_9PROT|nr:ParB/RepB/Spo0J family partition protein [Nitrosomonas eutropha]SFU33860.1 ParB/RepB/Spo0J family partition protein [Nitrosomonas eutropha]
MTNPIIKAAAGKFGKGIQSLAVEQSMAKAPEIPLDLIIIKKQIRTEFENDENPLSELADDIKTRGVLQPVLVRPMQGGKYELVAGERRYRAAKMAGLKAIPVLVKSMTDEEADAAQFIENIKRKNLTLQEEAQRIQRDLDACGGDVEAVLKKYGKPKSGRVWIYKIRGLLNLSEQAQRLISENITADIEVIGDVRQIEKVNPAKAKETVDALKAASTAKKTTATTDADGNNNSSAKPAKSGNMREISRNAKAEVAPTKRQAAKKDDEKAKENQATSRNRDAEAPGQVFTVFPATSASIQLNNEARDDVLQVDDEEGRATLEKMLRGFFDKGADTVEWVAAVSEGIRQRDYDDSSMGRLKLAALSAGFAKSEGFNLDMLIDKAKNL